MKASRSSPGGNGPSCKHGDLPAGQAGAGDTEAQEVNPLHRALAKCEAALAVLLTLAAVHLHWTLLVHAGGLWRDEICIVNMAALPSVADLAKALPHDHCPVFFPTLLRAWTGLGLAKSDETVRVLGLCVGLSLLAVCWIGARRLSRGLPLVSLALVTLNAGVIRYGDSIRAYGLAAAAIVLAAVLMWEFVARPGKAAWALAAAGAVAAVQAAYQNAFLMLALCLAGCAVVGPDRRQTMRLAVIGIGAVAALSLVPYVPPILRAQEWWVVSKAGVDPGIAWRNVSALAGFPHPLVRFVWLGLIVTAVCLGFVSARSSSAATAGAPPRQLRLFAATALAGGLVGFGVFIALARLPTQPWYYLIPLALGGVLVDSAVATTGRRGRLVVAASAAMIGLSSYAQGLSALKARFSNGDVLAAAVSREVRAGDFVVVHPWYFGITFNHYYRGEAPWTTLPPLGDYRYHRYDLLKEQLAAVRPIQPVMDRAAAALAAGNKVWVIGWLPPHDPAQPPPELPPAPHGPQKWFDEPYSWSWGLQFAHFLANNATNAVLLKMDESIGPVMPAEEMSALVVTGWRGTETRQAGTMQ